MSAALVGETAEQVLRYVTAARWFAGKGRRAQLTGVTPLPWVTDRGAWPAVRFEVAAIAYPGGGGEADTQPADLEPTATQEGTSNQGKTPTELYQLAVAYYPTPQEGLTHAHIGTYVDADLGEVVGYDAMQDPAACRTLLDQLLRPRSHANGRAGVSFHLLSGEALDPGLEPRIFTGQQSNTSVMYGDAAMLKLFRRLEIGRNLDIEVHESLSRAGVSDVAQLYGWVEGSWPAAGSTTGPTLTADLAMVVQKLADAVDGWGLALEWLTESRDFTGLAADLGRALAEIHGSLRTAFGSTQVSGASTAAVMRGRLAVAAGIAPALEAHVDGLSSCFGALGETQLVTQRVHGDFHLGQTLHTPTGWKIIDFEGEPVKSLAERAEPDSVWRDIAGMLRSFDYAAASVPGPDSRGWADSCREAFLEGYAGGPMAPEDAVVLRAYEADKAVYEVVYEVRNRPDWVNIPLVAIAAIAHEGG